MFEPNVTRKDRTAAERARRYRERKRHAATAVRDAAHVTDVTPGRVTLTATQESALDVLLDVIEAHGRPGSWSDGEPAAPIELWRTKLRNMFQGNTNPRQAVRRTVTAMVRLGVVLERDGMVAVGTFGVDIKVAGSTW